MLNSVKFYSLSLILLLFSTISHATSFQGIAQTLQIPTKGTVHDIVLFNNDKYALVASEQEGILLLDVSDPFNTTLISNFSTTYHAESIALAHNEKIAYITNGAAGLDIIDVFNLQRLKLLSRYQTPCQIRVQYYFRKVCEI